MDSTRPRHHWNVPSSDPGAPYTSAWNANTKNSSPPFVSDQWYVQLSASCKLLLYFDVVFK